VTLGVHMSLVNWLRWLLPHGRCGCVCLGARHVEWLQSHVCAGGQELEHMTKLQGLLSFHHPGITSRSSCKLPWTPQPGH
jgi:hypothetical protein